MIIPTKKHYESLNEICFRLKQACNETEELLYNISLKYLILLDFFNQYIKYSIQLFLN